ncbi:UNVERIFIED_CONTAM: hypothetical protein GTU68_038490 [Idotea baltica]|nr:hypothetical protein [Idotea baltica]
MILADDMRWDYVRAMNPEAIVKTPHLDQLAQEGALFKNAFVTSSICTPSRTSIMTGMYERKHGITFGANAAMTEHAFAQTYPMLLKKNGYHMGYVGKNHTPIGRSDTGFGYESGVMDASFDYWQAGHKHLTFYPKKRHDIFKNAKADNQLDIIQEVVDAFMDSDQLENTADNFLHERPEDQPFCLMVNLNVPHSSSTTSMKQLPSDPALYRTAYREKADQIVPPDNYVAYDDIKIPKLPPSVYNGLYLNSYAWTKTAESLRENQIRTCQTVEGIDHLVGSIIRQLKEQSLLENTIIVFTSDHGLFHGEQGLGGKTLLYDVALRVPMFIYASGLSNGKEVDEIALNIDIAPTLLDFANIEIPQEMQGHSLKPLMEGKKNNWRSDFFAENLFMGQNYPRMEAVRSERWKYIRYFDKEKDQHHILSLISPMQGEQPIYEELYDLSKDPDEETNLINDKDLQKIVSQFRLRCSQLLIEAKGNNQLPDTYIKDFEDQQFKDRVVSIYQELKVN